MTFLGGGWVRRAALPFPDNHFRLADHAVPTGLAAFDLSGLSAGATRSFTQPNLCATRAHLGNAAQTSGDRPFCERHAEQDGRAAV